MYRALQHIAVIVFVLSFTNQAADLLGNAILPVKILSFVIAAAAMYLANGKSGREQMWKTKNTSWLLLAGIILVSFVLAVIRNL